MEKQIDNGGIFDKTHVYSAKIEGLVKQIRIICETEGIPLLMCFGIKDDGQTTTYKNFINTPAERVGLLSQDIIPDCVNVLFNGFKAIAYDNIMEYDVQNHTASKEAMAYASYEGKTDEESGAAALPQEEEGQLEIPKSWEVTRH